MSEVSKEILKHVWGCKIIRNSPQGIGWLECLHVSATFFLHDFNYSLELCKLCPSFVSSFVSSLFLVVNGDHLAILIICGHFFSHHVPSLSRLLPDWSVYHTAAYWAAATVATLIKYCKTKTKLSKCPEYEMKPN